jgi:hypothetical protein
VADAVDASLKRSFSQAIAFKPDQSYADCVQLVNDVKSNTSIKLFTFDTNDIKAMKMLLPSTLKAIKGTATLHEFIVEKYGKVFMKEASDKPPKEIKDF